MDFPKFQGNVLSLVDKFTPETGKNARKTFKKNARNNRDTFLRSEIIK